MDPEKATVIDAQSAFEGRLTGKDARVLGRFKGEIELTGRLVLGEGSRVEARVLADTAEVAGQFEGDIVARSLEVLEKARLTGSFDAEGLSIREGAVVNGSVSAGKRQRAESRAQASETSKGSAQEPKPSDAAAPAGAGVGTPNSSSPTG